MGSLIAFRLAAPDADAVAHQALSNRAPHEYRVAASTSSTTVAGRGKDGTGTLLVDGRSIAQGRIDRRPPGRGLGP